MNLRRLIFCISLIALFHLVGKAQTVTYTNSNLSVDIEASHPCDGVLDNGFLEFTIASSDNNVNVLVFGPGFTGPESFTNVSVGSVLRVDNTAAVVTNGGTSGTYNFIVTDLINPAVSISTLADPVSFPPITLVDLATITITDDVLTDNTDCNNPDGQLEVSISGGSQALPGGGSYDFTWSSIDSGAPGLPFSGTFDGTSSLDLVAQLGLGGLPGGTYTLTVTDNFSVCGATMNFTIADPVPNIFNVQDPGTLCEDEDFEFMLDGSDPTIPFTVTYEVFINGSGSGITLIGDGNPLTFIIPNGTVGQGDLITVQATSGICTPIFMNGNIVADFDFIPNDALVVTAADPIICNPGATNILINNSESGVSYQLRNDAGDINVGSAILGNGAQLNLPTGTLTSTTTFNVLATNGSCPPIELTTLVTVTVNQPPDISLGVIANPSTVCEGESSFIEVASSEVNVSYQLRDDSDNSPVGIAVIGTGGTIVLPTGNLTVTTTFNVLASVPFCPDAQLTQTATVTVDPAPDLTLPVSANPSPICSGESSQIFVDNSEIGVDYQLRVGTTNVGAVVPGDGAQLAFPTGSLTATTVFNILAIRGACMLQLDNTAEVIVNPLPVIVIGSNSPLCIGDDLILTESGGDAISWSWTGPDGFTSTDQNPMITSVTLAASGVYTVTVTDVNGCMDTDNVNVIVNDLPVANDVNLGDVCDQSILDLTLNEGAINGGAGITYNYFEDINLTVADGQAPPAADVDELSLVL